MVRMMGKLRTGGQGGTKSTDKTDYSPAARLAGQAKCTVPALCEHCNDSALVLLTCTRVNLCVAKLMKLIEEHALHFLWQKKKKKITQAGGKVVLLSPWFTPLCDCCRW